MIFNRRFGTALVAVATLASGMNTLAMAEAGDGGDPTAVNLRADFPARGETGPLTLGPRLEGGVRAYSEANGPQSATFAGYARFGIDRTGPGISLRSTLTKVRVEGSVEGTGPLIIRVSAHQRAILRRAASRARRDTVALNVVLRGSSPGRAMPSKVNSAFRVHVR